MRNETLEYYLKKTIFLALLCLMLIVPMISVPSKGGDENRFFFSRDIKTLNNWSEDAQLTNLSTIDRWVADPVVVASGDFAHIIYCEVWQPGISFRRDLRYLGSSDKGKTWSTVVNLTETNFYATYPDAALYNDNIYVTWQDYRDHPGHPEIYFKNSSDNGQTWSNDTALTSNDGYASQWPYIGAWNNTIHVVWCDFRVGSYGDIYYKRGIVQENGSIIWDDGLGNVSADRRITFYGEYNSECYPQDITVYNSSVHVIGTRILDTSERVVIYTKTEDNGANWSTPEILSTMWDGHSWGTGVAVNDSNIHIVWMETKHDGVREVYYRNSTNSGDTWNPETRLTNTLAEEYDPRIAVNGSLVWVSWWSTGDNCGYCRLSKDNGTTWEDPVQLTTQSGTPILAVSEGYVHAVFTSDRTGNSEIYYKRHPKFNDPPEITEWYPQTNVTITETQTQTFTVNATDPDNDTLTYQWYLSDTLLINETHSSYTFTPSENFSGNYSVKVSVSDGKDFANHTWIVTVINVKQLQETINTLLTQLSQLIHDYTGLLENLTLLSDYLTSVWSQLNSSELNNTKLQTKLQGLSENLSALREQLNLSQQSSTTLQSFIYNLNQTLNISNQQITTLWSLLNQSLVNQTQLGNQLIELNNTISSLRKEMNALEKENELIVKEREVAEERLMIAVIVLIGVILVCVVIGASKRKK